jgi:hypothetical protein
MDSPAPLEARHSGNQLSVRLRGFGPVGLLAIVLILLGNFIFIPLSAVLVFVVATSLKNVLARNWFCAAAQLEPHNRDRNPLRRVVEVHDEGGGDAFARR